MSEDLDLPRRKENQTQDGGAQLLAEGGRSPGGTEGMGRPPDRTAFLEAPGSFTKNLVSTKGPSDPSLSSLLFVLSFCKPPRPTRQSQAPSGLCKIAYVLCQINSAYSWSASAPRADQKKTRTLVLRGGLFSRSRRAHAPHVRVVWKWVKAGECQRGAEGGGLSARNKARGRKGAKAPTQGSMVLLHHLHRCLPLHRARCRPLRLWRHCFRAHPCCSSPS